MLCGFEGQATAIPVTSLKDPPAICNITLTESRWRDGASEVFMYCPQCGSNNTDGLKFCTRCGANLGIVAVALSGKFDQPTEIDERLVKLLKNYYRGRRTTVLGLILTALMTFKLSLAMFLGMPDKFIPLVAILGLFFIAGLVWFIWGATRWNNASSELKALGYDSPQSALPKTKRVVDRLPESSTVLTVKSPAPDLLRTDPLQAPPSVTEQTTRFLEEERKAAPEKVSN
jgi:hypothetical protein